MKKKNKQNACPNSEKQQCASKPTDYNDDDDVDDDVDVDDDDEFFLPPPSLTVNQSKTSKPCRPIHPLDGIAKLGWDRNSSETIPGI